MDVNTSPELYKLLLESEICQKQLQVIKTQRPSNHENLDLERKLLERLPQELIHAPKSIRCKHSSSSTSRNNANTVNTSIFKRL